MNRRKLIGLGMGTAIAATLAATVGLNASAAPPKGSDLTSNQKLQIIQSVIKTKPAGLETPVRLSARKTYQAGKADLTINNAILVDPVHEKIEVQATNSMYSPQTLAVRFKPSRAGKAVLVDFAFAQNTNGTAKVVARPAVGSEKVELTLNGAVGSVEHLTVVARPTTTDWVTYYVGVEKNNVFLKYVEVTPTL
jgi:hypothetical protein